MGKSADEATITGQREKLSYQKGNWLWECIIQILFLPVVGNGGGAPSTGKRFWLN